MTDDDKKDIEKVVEIASEQKVARSYLRMGGKSEFEDWLRRLRMAPLGEGAEEAQSQAASGPRPRTFEQPR